jgi:hypothetical protein
MSALRAGAVIDLLLGTTLTLWTLRNWAVFGAFQPIAPRYCSDIGEYAPTGFIRWFKTWLVEFADLRDIYWRVSSDPQDEGQPVELAAIPPRALDNPGKKQAVLWDIYKRIPQQPGDGLPVARISGLRLRDRSEGTSQPGIRTKNAFA